MWNRCYSRNILCYTYSDLVLVEVLVYYEFAWLVF